jgi:hypothetical protein
MSDAGRSAKPNIRSIMMKDRCYFKSKETLQCLQRRIQMIYNKSQGHNRSYGVPFLKVYNSTHIRPRMISTSFKRQICWRFRKLWRIYTDRSPVMTNQTTTTTKKRCKFNSLIMMTAIRFKDYKTTVLLSRQLVYVTKAGGKAILGNVQMVLVL